MAPAPPRRTFPGHCGFLSGHREYRGDPESVKRIFIKTATDLGRDRAYQGAGMVDLLRAMMSV